MSKEPNDGVQEILDLEMISELYAAVEEYGQVPNFIRVLKDLKQTLCPGSSHSRFSFLVRLLYIKSRYRFSNTTFNAILKLLSSAFPTPNYLQHMMMQISVFVNWALDTTRSMCSIITVCCSGTGMPTWMPAQNAKNLDAKIRMANVFLEKF